MVLSSSLAVAIAVLVLCPTAASAATASLDRFPHEAVVHYDAAPGEANRVTFAAQGADAVAFSDPGATIVPGAGCAAQGPHRVVCTDPDAGAKLFLGDLSLGDGNDRARVTTLPGQGFVDVLGQAGDDRIDLSGLSSAGDRQGDDLQGGTGDDTVLGGVDRDAISGGPGADRLSGGAGNDLVKGEAGRDAVAGGPGDDVLEGDDGVGPATDCSGAVAAEADAIDGGTGRDTVAYSDYRVPVRVDLAHPGDAGAAGEHDRLAGLESVVGGIARDVLRGDGRANRLQGGPEPNFQLDPENPCATPQGAPGDVLDGRGGNDRLRAESERDILIGGSGNDTLGDDFFGGRLRCGAGFDTVPLPQAAGYDDAPLLSLSRCERAITELSRVASLTSLAEGLLTIAERGPAYAICRGSATLRARVSGGGLGALYGRASWSFARHGSHTHRARVHLTAAGRRAARRHGPAVLTLANRSRLHGCAATPDRADVAARVVVGL